MTTHAHLSTVVLPLPHAIQGGFAVPTAGECADPHAALTAGFDLLHDVEAWLVHLARESHRNDQVPLATRPWESDPYWVAYGADPALVRRHERDRSTVLVGLLVPVRHGLLADRLAATCALALMRALGVDAAEELHTERLVSVDEVLASTKERRLDERMRFAYSGRKGVTTLTSEGLGQIGLTDLMVDDIPRALIGQVFDVVKGLCVVLQDLAAQVQDDAAFLEIPSEVVVSGVDVARALGLTQDPWVGRSVRVHLFLDVHVERFESPWVMVRAQRTWAVDLRGIQATKRVPYPAASQCACCRAGRQA